MIKLFYSVNYIHGKVDLKVKINTHPYPKLKLTNEE